MIQIEPTISYEQYKTASRMSCPPARRTSSWAWRLWSWRITVAGSLILLAIAGSFQESAALTFDLMAFAVACLLWLLCRLYRRRAQEKAFRSVWTVSSELLNSQIIMVDETGIVCRQKAGTIQTQYLWQAFLGKVETEDGFLFIPYPYGFVRVPADRLEVSEMKQVQAWSKLVPDYCMSGMAEG